MGCCVSQRRKTDDSFGPHRHIDEHETLVARICDYVSESPTSNCSPTITTKKTPQETKKQNGRGPRCSGQTLHLRKRRIRLLPPSARTIKRRKELELQMRGKSKCRSMSMDSTFLDLKQPKDVTTLPEILTTPKRRRTLLNELFPQTPERAESYETDYLEWKIAAEDSDSELDVDCYKELQNDYLDQERSREKHIQAVLWSLFPGDDTATLQTICDTEHLFFGDADVSVLQAFRVLAFEQRPLLFCYDTGGRLSPLCKYDRVLAYILKRGVTVEQLLGRIDDVQYRGFTTMDMQGASGHSCYSPHTARPVLPSFQTKDASSPTFYISVGDPICKSDSERQDA